MVERTPVTHKEITLAPMRSCAYFVLKEAGKNFPIASAKSSDRMSTARAWKFSQINTLKWVWRYLSRKLLSCGDCLLKGQYEETAENLAIATRPCTRCAYQRGLLSAGRGEASIVRSTLTDESNSITKSQVVVNELE